MSGFGYGSLQLRLAVRLGVLLLVATLVAAGTFFYLSYRTADTLSRRDLFRLADELAESIHKDGTLEPIEALAARGLLEDDTIFAMRDAEGRLLAVSGDEVRDIVRSRPLAGRRPQFFRLDGIGAAARVYTGFEREERSRIGPVSVLVAEPDDAENELLNAMLDEIALAAAWIIPVFIAATLLVGVFAIRSGLRPLRDTAAQAATIRPDAMSVRLGVKGLPSELLVLVDAVNRALDRLEEGFAQQRRFTANAAHELRTPLAIITGALDTIEGDGRLAELQRDVARMNRLVEQLLHVARLDSVELDVTGEVRLRQCAREAVEDMAPLAIEQGRSLALAGTEQDVVVKGNVHAIRDAIRNLIANALQHTPAGTEVLVVVGAKGTVSVCDHGSGIAAEDAERIFDRFWRGSGGSGTGAGLGLAIVQEIVKLHGGSVEVTDNIGGGACFTLRFPGRR